MKINTVVLAEINNEWYFTYDEIIFVMDYDFARDYGSLLSRRDC